MGFGICKFEQLLQYLGSWLVGREGIAHKHHHLGITMHDAVFCTREGPY
jgi:hypothetical protein